MPHKDPEKRKEWQRKYRQKNKEKLEDWHKKYYQENKERICAQKKKYHQENKERDKKRIQRWRQKHKEELKIKEAIFRQKNRERLNKAQKKRKENTFNVLYRIEAWCQFDGCETDNRYMLCEHHLFPRDEETKVILCFNHHQLIDHYKEGFYESEANLEE